MLDDLEAARAELLEAADALGKLLEDHGEQHWAAWVTRDRQRINDGDASGVNHLLRAYGGMGSLNDVLIHPANGHHIAAEDIEAVNARLAQLRSQTYAAAMRLKMS